MISEKRVVFLAFANNLEIPQAYLPTLNRESSNIFRKLWPYREQQFIDLHKEENASIQDIFTAFTELFPDRICLFHYGGHADGGHLMLEAPSGREEKAGSEGLAVLLGQQKGLKLVFLNGCSTQEQVDLLFASGVKAVIATHTAINDTAATEFAEQFYTSLANERNIIEAYTEARALIETKYDSSNIVRKKETVYHRSIFLDEEFETDLFPWGLYVAENHENILKWKLPKSRLDIAQLLDQQQKIKRNDLVNDHIILPVFKALQSYNPSLEIPMDEDDEIDELNLQNKIIESYPLPIGEQIRKLFANTEDMYNFGIPRLQQIVRTYEVIIRFLSYVSLSQLWDQINRNPHAKIAPMHIMELNNFAVINRQNYHSFDYVSLLQTITQIFKNQTWKLFLPELGNLTQELAKRNELYHAYIFLQKIRVHIAEESVLAQHIEEFCSQGEYHLSIVLQKIAFLSNYRLITVKDILFKKERMEEPAYAINMGILKGTDPKRIKEKARRYEEYTDSQSVLLVKNVKEISDYQSLSPFLIDENALTGHLNFKVFFYAFGEEDRSYYEFVDTGDLSLEINPSAEQSDSYTSIIQKQLMRFRANLP